MLRRAVPVTIALCGAPVLVSWAGCKKAGGPAEADAGPGPSDTGVAITAEARQEATQIFTGRCTPCHGPTGAGDGPSSKQLSPPPRDFRDPAWQAQVTDDHIENIIRFGGAAVGKSPGMPPNPDLVERPEVVAALREHVRGLKTAK